MTEQVIAVVGIIGMKVYYKVRRPLRPFAAAATRFD
eukprot:SAG25_NODE_395_length_8553_cov_4.407263_10_plen_36_part_00